MVTKAEILSINSAGTKCSVRMPLFETSSSGGPVQAEALVNITPGLYSNLVKGDVVFVAFEENAIEKPIIIGKLFTGANKESKIRGGYGILDELKVHTAASIPSSTLFVYPEKISDDYNDFKTPHKLADYIKWLEDLTKKLIKQLDDHFRCFKNWVQWQLKPENMAIDDGEVATSDTSSLYQDEGAECKICGKKCTKNEKRCYLALDITKKYPKV